MLFSKRFFRFLNLVFTPFFLHFLLFSCFFVSRCCFVLMISLYGKIKKTVMRKLSQ